MKSLRVAGVVLVRLGVKTIGVAVLNLVNIERRTGLEQSFLFIEQITFAFVVLLGVAIRLARLAGCGPAIIAGMKVLAIHRLGVGRVVAALAAKHQPDIRRVTAAASLMWVEAHRFWVARCPRAMHRVGKLVGPILVLGEVPADALAFESF